MFKRICFALMCVGLLAITPNASAALGPNLLANGDLDDGTLSGWDTGNNPDANVGVVNGSNALCLNVGGASFPLAAATGSIWTIVDPTKTYELSFTYSCAYHPTNSPMSGIEMYLAQGTTILNDLVGHMVSANVVEYYSVTFGPDGDIDWGFTGGDYRVRPGFRGSQWGHEPDRHIAYDDVRFSEVVAYDPEAAIEAIEAKLDAGVGGGGDPVDLTEVNDKLDALEIKADLDRGAIDALEVKADLDRAALNAIEDKIDIIDELLRTPQGQRSGWNN